MLDIGIFGNSMVKVIINLEHISKYDLAYFGSRYYTQYYSYIHVAESAFLFIYSFILLGCLYTKSAKMTQLPHKKDLKQESTLIIFSKVNLIGLLGWTGLAVLDFFVGSHFGFHFFFVYY